MTRGAIVAIGILVIGTGLLFVNLSRRMPGEAFGLYVVLLGALVAAQVVVRVLVARSSRPGAEKLVDLVSAASIGLFVYLFARHVFPALP